MDIVLSKNLHLWNKKRLWERRNGENRYLKPDIHAKLIEFCWIQYYTKWRCEIYYLRRIVKRRTWLADILRRRLQWGDQQGEWGPLVLRSPQAASLLSPVVAGKTAAAVVADCPLVLSPEMAEAAAVGAGGVDGVAVVATRKWSSSCPRRAAAGGTCLSFRWKVL